MLGPYYITTDARRRTAYGDACGSKATAASVTIDGRTFKCRAEAAVPFAAWEKIRVAHGYRLTGTDTGIYSCRHMRHDSSLPYSYHSWGMALDVNWLENPAGSKLITDIPKTMRDDILALRTTSGARVFRWGGDWDWDGVSTDSTYIDAMHWEVVAHPLDLATGVKGTTIQSEDLMTVSTWAQASWDKAQAEGIITADSIPKANVTVEQLMVFLNRAGAFDQVGNVSSEGVIDEIVARLKP